MKVEVINTGSELLLGDVLNSHLAFMARELFGLGLRISRQATVPDGETIRSALVEAFSRADVVLVTGGLGPTSDDLTRDFAAELTGRSLVHDKTLAQAIRERFRSNNLKLAEQALRQAQVPSGAVVLENQNGTAPGLYFPSDRGVPHLFLLPGPPRELEPMFREQVLPILGEIVPCSADVREANFRLVGIGESQVEELIGDGLKAIDGLEVGYCARPGQVDIRCLGGTDALSLAERIVSDSLSEHIATRDKRELEEVIVSLLASRGAKLATAESCTGGALANRVTNVPGSSEVFVEGFVTYANEAKIRTLEIDPAILAGHGAVSREVAEAMAANARRLAGTDYALSTTGIAGPGGGSEDKPVGTVFIGFATRFGTVVQRRLFRNDRLTFKQRTSLAALDILRRSLAEQA